VWVAASNALARLRSPGFAASLLREIHLTNSIRVSDTGHYLPEGAAGSGMLSNSKMQVPPLFPPIGLYWLTAEHVTGDKLASPGTIPIYVRRVVMEPGVDRSLIYPEDGSCAPCEAGCPKCQAERIGYLSGLLHEPHQHLDRVLDRSTEMKWSSPAQLSEAIRWAVIEQQKEIRQLAKRLVSAKLMEASDLDMVLRIEVLVEDRRSDRTTPLAQYKTSEFRLQ
jgi:hypothetical protein